MIRNNHLSNSGKTSFILAVVGGFLESYTYTTRNGVFANAQTGNIARMGIKIAEGNWIMAGRYLLPVLTFVGGVILVEQFKARCTDKNGKKTGHVIMFILEAILLFIAGLIPSGRYDVLVTTIIAFACSIQLESIRAFDGNAFSSTMCTGNLRSGTENLNTYIISKDRKYLKKALHYYYIDMFFVGGVITGYLLTVQFTTHSVWFCLVPLSYVIIDQFCIQ